MTRHNGCFPEKNQAVLGQFETFEEPEHRPEAAAHNLAVFHYLRQHPDSAEKDLPGKVSWHNSDAPFIDYVWQTAEQTGVTSFMNQGEVRRNSEPQRRLKICNDDYSAFRGANTEARAYTVDDADLSHLSPIEIQEQIRLTRIMLNRLYRYGPDLRNLSIANPDFVPAPSVEEIGSIVHESAQERRDLEENMKRLHGLDDLPDSFPSDEKR